MPVLRQGVCRNRLLALMSADDFARLAPELDFVESPRGSRLTTPDRSDFVYFPESGVVSIMATSSSGKRLETALLGREGFGPTSAILGTSALRSELIVQVAGGCYRLSRTALAGAATESASLRDLLLRYVQVLLDQTGQTALSSAAHSVEERLARWILMVHDRVDADEFCITHDVVALALSVRRPSVTSALHMLEGRHLIRSERGHIGVRDRVALERLAHDSYGGPEAAYAHLIGPTVSADAGAQQPELASHVMPAKPDLGVSDVRETDKAHHERRLVQKEMKLASAESALAAGGEAARWRLKADVTKLRSAVLRLEATIAHG